MATTKTLLSKREVSRLLACLDHESGVCGPKGEKDFAKLQALGLVKLAPSRGLSEERYIATEAGRQWLLGPQGEDDGGDEDAEKDDGHVDSFIWRGYATGEMDAATQRAKFILMMFRLPAAQYANWNTLVDTKLFCTYKGVRYRVTGASRFGDIYLREDPAKDCGYDLRVKVSECSCWGARRLHHVRA